VSSYKKFFLHIRKYLQAMTQLIGAGLPVSLVLAASTIQKRPPSGAVFAKAMSLNRA
jgi:hypothetical protein